MAFLANRALTVGAIALVPSLTSAQASSQDSPAIEDLKRRLAELDSKHTEEIEDLKFQVETLEKEVAAAQAAARARTAQSNNVFNPQITVFSNFVARLDDRPAFVDDDPAAARIDDSMYLRETEFDFRAPIDPWADAVVIASIASPAPGEFETSIEEGYFMLKRLPFSDSAPAGLKLQVGRFHQDFGRLNKIHLHDLPQPSYPRALTNFLGADAYVQDGIAGQFFLPSPSESSTLQASIAVVDGGGIPVDDASSHPNLANLEHVEWFGELSDSQSLNLGVSAWSGDTDHALYGLDATYKWKPLAGGEWSSFLIGAEYVVAALDDPNMARHPGGLYLWSQYQFDRNFYGGVRFDRAEELDDASQSTRTYGAYLTYYTTEFLRFRLALEHTDSDVAGLDGRDTALLEMNMVFGSHPVEPYWVNR